MVKFYISAFFFLIISNSYGQKLEFQTVYDKIFAPKCIKCHSGSTPSDGVDLTTYKDLWSASGQCAILNDCGVKLIVKFQPGESKVYLEIESGDMPKYAERLSEEDITLLYDWITAGAPEFSNN